MNTATTLAQLAGTVAGCTRCPALVACRTRPVFGAGPPTARLMLVSEAPGLIDDQNGELFAGPSGAFLTRLIGSTLGLSRDEVYLTNVLKCRPDDNRRPTPTEILNCLPYLERQLAAIQPHFLVLMGQTAASALLETSLPLARLRGKWHRYRGIPTLVTIHPAVALRDERQDQELRDDFSMLHWAMGGRDA